MDVPSFGATRALCAYQKGTLGNGANGQRWNFKTEVTHLSLKALLTWVYASASSRAMARLNNLCFNIDSSL